MVAKDPIRAARSNIHRRGGLSPQLRLPPTDHHAKSWLDSKKLRRAWPWWSTASRETAGSAQPQCGDYPQVVPTRRGAPDSAPASVLLDADRAIAVGAACARSPVEQPDRDRCGLPGDNRRVSTYRDKPDTSIIRTTEPHGLVTPHTPAAEVYEVVRRPPGVVEPIDDACGLLPGLPSVEQLADSVATLGFDFEEPVELHEIIGPSQPRAATPIDEAHLP